MKKLPDGVTSWDYLRELALDQPYMPSRVIVDWCEENLGPLPKVAAALDAVAAMSSEPTQYHTSLKTAQAEVLALEGTLRGTQALLEASTERVLELEDFEDECTHLQSKVDRLEAAAANLKLEWMLDAGREYISRGLLMSENVAQRLNETYSMLHSAANNKEE